MSGSARTFDPNVHDLHEIARALKMLRLQVPIASYDWTGTPPGANDDITKGWKIGSKIITTDTHIVYECSSNAAGDAKWQQMSGFSGAAGGGGGSVATADCVTIYDSSEGANISATLAQVLALTPPGVTDIDDLTDVDTVTDPPQLSEALKWNGTNWVPAPYDYNFVFSVATFLCNQTATQLIGAGVWKAINAIDFDATYNNGPPDSASIAMSGGGDANWAAPLAMTSPFAHIHQTVQATNYPASKDTTVTFRLTAIKGLVTDNTKTTTVVFRNYIWHGPTLEAAVFTEADVEALGTATLSNTPAGSRSFAAGVLQYIALAYPASYASMHAYGFLYKGMTCPMTLDTSTLSITNSAGKEEPYKVYVSTIPNLGTSTLVASTLDTRLDPLYYGKTTKLSGYFESDVEGLANSTISNDNTQVWNSITTGAGEYMLFAFPTRLGVPVFYVGGFAGGFGTPETVWVTNINGFGEDYYVWRSTNPNLGAVVVETKAT